MIYNVKNVPMMSEIPTMGVSTNQIVDKLFVYACKACCLSDVGSILLMCRTLSTKAELEVSRLRLGILPIRLRSSYR